MKEDVISYQDWCSEVQEALEKEHDPAKIKEAMFVSLEGMAKDNAKMIDENGNLHVARILDGLDSLWGVPKVRPLVKMLRCCNAI